jgi:hypothetical protein
MKFSRETLSENCETNSNKEQKTADRLFSDGPHTYKKEEEESFGNMCVSYSASEKIENGIKRRIVYQV